VTLVLTYAITATGPAQAPPARDLTQISLEDAMECPGQPEAQPGLDAAGLPEQNLQEPRHAEFPDSELIDRMLSQSRVLGKTTWRI
jgi:hypothetical protein